jgi:integrase
MMVELHADIVRKAGPMAARNAMIALRAWWRLAQTLDPHLPECPVVAVMMHPQAGRDSSDLYARLGEWHEALSVIRSPVRRAFYEMALLTGIRRTSLMTARWQDVKDGVLHVPSPKRARGKAPRPYAIPLTDAHMAILDRLDAWRRVVAPQSPWIFPGDRRDHITDVTLTTAESRDWAARGAPSFSPHNLRAAFLTAAAEARVHPYAISVMANHAIPGTAGAYIMDTLDIREAVERTVRHLRERLGGAMLAACPVDDVRLGGSD